MAHQAKGTPEIRSTPGRLREDCRYRQHARQQSGPAAATDPIGLAAFRPAPIRRARPTPQCAGR